MRAWTAMFLLATLVMPTFAVMVQADSWPARAGADPRMGEPWWDYNWFFRRPVTVDNTGNAEALANYEVLLNVSYDGDMKSDFADLRFAQFNQTSGLNMELPHYIEQKTDGASASIWVNVASIPASGSATMHMYYGNPSAASNSSAAATFDFFDDFSTDPSARWTGVSGSVSWDSSNKWYSITNSGGSSDTVALRAIATSMTPIKDTEVVMKVDLDGSSSPHDGGPLGRMVDNNNGYGIRLQADNYFALRTLISGVSSHIGYVQRTVSMRAWYWVKLQTIGTTIRGRYWAVGAAEPNAWDNSVQDSNFTGVGRVGVYQDRGGPSRFDDVRARKITAVEPSPTVGAEELPFKFKSLTFSPARLNIGETVFFNATFNNPTTEVIKLPLGAREADNFTETSDYFHQEQVTLMPGADTTFSFSWTAVGGPHTIWLAVYDFPFASAKIRVNRPPVIAPVKDQSLWQDRDFLLQVNASDPDGDSLTWSTDNALFNISPVSNRSAEMTFLPTNDFIGVHRVNITVRDTLNRTDTRRVNFTVNNVNDPPALAKIPSLSATQYKELRYQAKATDADVKWGDVLTFSDNTDLLEIDARTGEFYFTPVEEQVGKHNVKVTVTDTAGASETSAFTITVANVNDPPTLEMLPPQFVLQGRLFQLKILAADPDVKSDATEKLRYGDDCPLFNINNDSGLISFTPTNDQLGVWRSNITVADKGGLSNTTQLVLTVMNANDPPALEAIAPQTATEGVPFNYQLTATDPDLKWGLDNLTFSDDTDIFNIDPKTGAIAFTPGSAQSGIKRVTITVKDDKGASASASFDLTIVHVNHPPYDIAIRYPVDGAKLKEDDAMWLEGTAKDLDKGDNLQYSWLDNGESVGTGRNISVKLKPGTHAIKLEVSDGTETISSEITVQVEKKETVTVTSGGIDGLPLALALAAVIAIVAVAAVVAARRRKRQEEPEPSEESRIDSVPEGEDVALPIVPPAEAGPKGPGEEGAAGGEEARAVIDSTLDKMADFQEAHPEEVLDVASVMEKLDIAREMLRSGSNDDALDFAMEASVEADAIMAPKAPPAPSAPKKVAVKKKKKAIRGTGALENRNAGPPAPNIKCPGCGEELDVSWSVCPACGFKTGN